MTEKDLAEIENYRGDCFCESQCQECNWSLSKIPALVAEVRRLRRNWESFPHNKHPGDPDAWNSCMDIITSLREEVLRLLAKNANLVESCAVRGAALERSEAEVRRLQRRLELERWMEVPEGLMYMQALRQIATLSPSCTASADRAIELAREALK